VSAFVLQDLPYALRSLWGFRTFTRLNNAIFPLTRGDLVLHENRRWKFTYLGNSSPPEDATDADELAAKSISVTKYLKDTRARAAKVLLRNK
jgi:hypothetical protein